jgi:GTPase
MTQAQTRVPVVALVGRPNVGKSALFNRVVGQGAAIVSEEAGTTRDRHFALAEWNGRTFYLVDTGGLTMDDRIPMDVEIRKQVEQAIGEADLLLLVLDATVGVHPSDRRILDLLRAANRPWMVIANKVDDPRDPSFYELYNLGGGDPFPVSATNGRGSGDLLDAIVAKIPDVAPPDTTTLRVAVIGRPNVGKSSFINRLLGEERLVVSDIAGTTRDAIDTPFKYHGRDLVFVDTAGLRRQARVDDGVEFYSTLRTRRAIESADVCVLLIDGTQKLVDQDLKIAHLAWDAGRGLVMVVNKWDLVEKDDKTAPKFVKEMVEKAPFLEYVPFLFTSAVTGQRVTRILDTLLEVERERIKRVSTSDVNGRLQELVARLQPPQSAGHEIRVNYATQVEVSPPHVVVFGNHPEWVAEHYVRYLHNGFRETFGWTGNPLRLTLKRKNEDRRDRDDGRR